MRFGAAWRSRFLLAVLVVVLLVVETTFGADLRVLGVAPDLMLLLAVVIGMVCGPRTGAWVGFFCGLATDMTMTTTPLGLSALTLCIVGWTVGLASEHLVADSRSLRPAIAFVASLCGVALFLLVGDVVGRGNLTAPGRPWLVRVAVVEGAWNALLAVPAFAVVRRITRGLRPAEGPRADAIGVSRVAG